MPDLPAGSPVLALDTPPERWNIQNAAVTTTSTTYEAGSPVCGTTFIAPTTGRVVISITAELDSAGTAITALSFRVGTGSSIGAGTEVIGPSDDTAITNLGSNQVRTSAPYPLDGLTPGATYNVRTMHKTNNASIQGTIRRRIVHVRPAT